MLKRYYHERLGTQNINKRVYYTALLNTNS